MSEFIFAYITCENSMQAEQIGSQLVEERLAACANIFPGSTSIYHWEGRLQKSEECLLLLKTRASLFEKLKETVNSIHTYNVPCILSFAINDGNEKFLEWVKAETE